MFKYVNMENIPGDVKRGPRARGGFEKLNPHYMGADSRLNLNTINITRLFTPPRAPWL